MDKQETIKEALKMLKEVGAKVNIKEDSDSEDSLKGEVADEEEEKEVAEGLIVEKAGFGKGYQMYRDYSYTPNLKRLCR